MTCHIIGGKRDQLVGKIQTVRDHQDGQAVDLFGSSFRDEDLRRYE
jgi:hypothetical protein